MTLFVFGEALGSIAVNLFTDLGSREFKYFAGTGRVILFTFGGSPRRPGGWPTARGGQVGQREFSFQSGRSR